MSDLISRQAAIDELERGAWGKKWDKTLAKAMIESVPSAEPGIIRCKDCKHWTQSTGKMKGYGFGRCDFHDADLVTCNGFCYWAEGRTDLIDRQALMDAFECLNLIDRQAATKSLVRPRVIDPYDHYWTGRNDQYDSDVYALKDLPSAEPERKKGHWIKHRDDWYSCSLCEAGVGQRYRFCPGCGADMRGGKG